MTLYRILYPIRKGAKATERWFGTKGEALRAYNRAVRDVNDVPSEFSDTTVQIELITSKDVPAKLVVMALNNESWRRTVETLHFHKVGEE